ncbi:hypothetical protein Z517_00897 [Fonsecaea pedrosoi CBS 271.37]|uniref:Uncharacterized protein n=1 Tax=Fonsecaea pedrosoi CBS 271.37 TaxID=1442368 RepID=A0A0D2E658_9EURO|nr:uncharacterized protein Z517_00897 [Fonsecaea pedrosoi CBS 271.37]KIW85506.1 hypothetical protein Z517_00897 [Fonsecaea pedrosoi CBS 271.37]
MDTSNINTTPRNPVGDPAAAKAMTGVACSNAAFIADRTPRGTKRSHQAAFGVEPCLKTVNNPPRVQLERPSALKASDMAGVDEAHLGLGTSRGSKSDQVSRVVSTKKAVSFNSQIKQVVFSRNNVIGHEAGLMTTWISDTPSVAWQKSQLRRAVLQRERCLKKARDGHIPACVMHLGSREICRAYSKASREHDEMSSNIASFADMTFPSSATDLSETGVRHFHNGDLYFQAIQEVENVVQYHLSALALDSLDSSNSANHSLRSAIEDLHRCTKENLTQLLKRFGIIYPYHSPKKRSRTAQDAYLDSDWTEADARAEALFNSCANLRVVGALRKIVEQFKIELEKQIGSTID